MVRTPSCDKSGLRKGTWTPEEDRKLIAYVTRYGCWNWRQLPKFAGLARCGKSCRLRWMNYLRPNIKRGNFTQEEEERIIRMHKKLGNRWSAIAAELPGRTDNEIKNHWHTTLKKRFQENTVTDEGRASQPKEKELKKGRDSVANNGVKVFQVTPPATRAISDNTGALSPLSSSSDFSDHSSAASNENLVLEDDFGFLDAYTETMMSENFWTDLHLDDIPYNAPVLSEVNGAFQSSDAKQIVDSCQSSDESMVVDVNHFGGFLDAFTEPTMDNFWTQPYVSDMSHVPSEVVFPSVAESEYFSPVCGADLWGQSTLNDEHLGLF